MAGLRLATLHGLGWGRVDHINSICNDNAHSDTCDSLIINYSLWRHIRVRKGRGRGPGRKRGQGAKERSSEKWQKRQRRDWSRHDDAEWDWSRHADAEWDWSRHDDDTCDEEDSWGAWECLECVNVNLFVSVSVRVVTHMWQGCDSPLVAGLRLATCGRVATRHTCYTSIMTSTAYAQCYQSNDDSVNAFI